MTRTKTVDNQVRRVWAKLASAAAQRAICLAKADKNYEAEDTMVFVEKWLNTAGANATRWSFRDPQP